MCVITLTDIRSFHWFDRLLDAGRQAVKAAGPFMVTLGFFVVLPLVWQLPICFITAELTTTFQVRKRPLARFPFLCHDEKMRVHNIVRIMQYDVNSKGSCAALVVAVVAVLFVCVPYHTTWRPLSLCRPAFLALGRTTEGASRGSRRLSAPSGASSTPCGLWPRPSWTTPSIRSSSRTSSASPAWCGGSSCTGPSRRSPGRCTGVRR